MMHTSVTRTALVCAVLILGAACGDVPSAHDLAFPNAEDSVDTLAATVRQVTYTDVGLDGNTDVPRITGDGSRIFFIGRRDAYGAAPSAIVGEEVFSMSVDGGALEQLTFFGDTSANSPTHLSISADGAKVAFERRGDAYVLDTATGDLAVEPNRRRPFLTDDGVYLLVTDRDGALTRIEIDGEDYRDLTPDGGVQWPMPATADHRYVVFASNMDLADANPDRNTELFRVDTETGDLMQLTDSIVRPHSPLWPVIARDTSEVFFQSNADYLGTNPHHRLQIWSVTIDGAQLTQHTFLTSDVDNLHPSITPDGATLALVRGASETLDTTSARVQHTHEDAGGVTIIDVALPDSALTCHPGITRDGARIVFYSDADPFGGNPDRSLEVFVYDRDAFRE